AALVSGVGVDGPGALRGPSDDLDAALARIAHQAPVVAQAVVGGVYDREQCARQPCGQRGVEVVDGHVQSIRAVRDGQHRADEPPRQRSSLAVAVRRYRREDVPQLVAPGRDASVQVSASLATLPSRPVLAASPLDCDTAAGASKTDPRGHPTTRTIDMKACSQVAASLHMLDTRTGAFYPIE